jgi:hypothetical protein
VLCFLKFPRNQGIILKKLLQTNSSKLKYCEEQDQELKLEEEQLEDKTRPKRTASLIV